MPSTGEIPAASKSGTFGPVPDRQRLILTAMTSSATNSSLSSAAATNTALHNFKLLEALRSDDPAVLQPFLSELKPGASGEDAVKTGRLLGMAARIASGDSGLP